MIQFANEYSAEHLEIQTKDPGCVFRRIKNAGSVFLGSYAPVAVGDYASGTNHCLPTGRSPKFSSPIGVETFMKTIQFQTLSRNGLKTLQPIVQTISRVEGLDGHERSVNIRLE
jgi:histidinol dehydrogenase